MKIYASKREYPTYEDYVKSGKFTKEQLAVLERAFTMNYRNMTPKKISIVANPEFSPIQMLTVLEGLAYLPVGIVLSYADPKYSADYMRFLNMRYDYSGSDISDEIIELIDSSSLSDPYKTEILQRTIDSEWDYDFLYEYLGHNYPRNFLDGISYWFGCGCADIMLALYNKYPNIFSHMDAGDIESLTEVLENLSWDTDIRNLPNANLSYSQIEMIIEALMHLYAGEVEESLIGKLIDPNLSVHKMKKMITDNLELYK